MANDLQKLRIERLAWVCIYGGLLAVVLGMAVQKQDGALGTGFQIGGSAVAAVGALLIWIRSRMQ